MTSRQLRKKTPRKPARSRGRTTGFHCSWCLRSGPRDERFVPNYYRPPATWQRDAWMCYACHLEGAGTQNGKPAHPTKVRPRLDPETLRQFWSEDTSSNGYVEAAADYFRVSVSSIKKVMQAITV